MTELDKLPSQVALDAAALLSKQDQLWKSGSGLAVGPYACIAMAIGKVCGSYRLGEVVRLQTDKVAAEQFPDRLDRTGPYNCVTMIVNDHPLTTLAEAISILEKSAVSFMEEGQ